MRPRYKVVGDVALVRLRDGEDPKEVVDYLLGRLPRLRAVLAYEGVGGELRLPRVRLLHGERPVVTRYAEHGVVYELDVERMMFSLGNKFERLRVAALTRDWEVVVDAFAGIGQFSLPIAALGRAVFVHAIEVNPEAYEYLVRNVRANGLEGRVRTHLGDCREVTKGLEGVADRVVMGYFPGTIGYLDAGLRALRPGGGVVHLHDLVEGGSEEEYCARVVGGVKERGYDVRLLRTARVKSYSARLDHVVLDLLCLPRRP
ncbi:MAG: hypothetical protein NZ953_01980 [Thaumarchaeota archaeon]|nr:hypothetical protein [Candidatus Calditenuaceae archaeon]MDW8043275.1 hypothetical protein [Nitrososphaerota archaeon]